MWTDEIVEEVRKAREEYAAKFDYDLEAIYNDLKASESRAEGKIVSLTPKGPDALPQAKAS